MCPLVPIWLTEISGNFPIFMASYISVNYMSMEKQLNKACLYGNNGISEGQTEQSLEIAV